jgi:predicted AAA+ superfamily ATPase
MVLVAGPRQVGKTTLALQLLGGRGRYYNWDNREDRKQILAAKWPVEPSIVVLDELHKYRFWKRWLKGEFDKHRGRLRFLVTGSARLDIYRRGGDSLQGRYSLYRLHPFSFSELLGLSSSQEVFRELRFHPRQPRKTLDELLRFGGFPEPILAKSARDHRRWQKERLDRFFREDVRDLSAVRDISLIQVLSDFLPERVGSLLSINALREDLEVSHKAVSHWLDVLEQLYFLFRLRPYHSKRIHSIKKDRKMYLWDYSLIGAEEARIENLVASHLLKFCHFLEDTEGYRIELHFLRDREKREVDFLVAVDGKPWFAVEVKRNDKGTSSSLRYFGRKLRIPHLYQVVWGLERSYQQDGVFVMSPSDFLSALR